MNKSTDPASSDFGQSRGTVDIDARRFIVAAPRRRPRRFLSNVPTSVVSGSATRVHRHALPIRPQFFETPCASTYPITAHSLFAKSCKSKRPNVSRHQSQLNLRTIEPEHLLRASDSAVTSVTDNRLAHARCPKIPVSSLSPATIRNVMSDLEDMGLVSAPHTSAGRIPTPQGYRMFVDTLVRYREPKGGDM